MLKTSIPIYLGCFILLGLSAFSVPGQEDKVALRDKQITIQMTRKPLYTVFYRLIQKYDIAIGLEESALDRGHRHYYFQTNVAPEELRAEASSDKEFLGPYQGFSENLITVNFKDASLEAVMDSIVAQMENYAWEFNDEVVNIFPIRGRDARLKKLLDVRVRVFAVGEGSDVGSIQGQLMLALPEFEKFLAENDLDCRTDRPGTSFVDRILPSGLLFTDMTFKQLLNAITKSKRGGWILQIKKLSDKPGKEFVEILI